MSTEQPNEPEQSTDYAKNKQVSDVLDKLMETEPPNIAWMTGELARRLLHALSSGRTLMTMSLLRAGMPKEEAEQQVAMQWPLLAFDLGMRAGREMEAVRQMREMFGETPPEFPT